MTNMEGYKRSNGNTSFEVIIVEVVVIVVLFNTIKINKITNN